MKKRQTLICGLLIALFITLGYVGIAWVNASAYQRLAEESVTNVLRLSLLDISQGLESDLIKPVTVSRTMAHDAFLQAWIAGEADHTEDEAYMDQLYAYLGSYQQTYGYDTVFFVSAKTGHYYYPRGLNKVVSPEDSHDVWYYNFLANGGEYDLEIDADQTCGDEATVFVNFRMEDRDGALLGVVGVGLRLSALEEQVRAYRSDYDLEVYFVNCSKSASAVRQGSDLFLEEEDLADRLGTPEPVSLSQGAEPQFQWFTDGGVRQCVVSNYEPALRWHILLKKDMASLQTTAQAQLRTSVAFLLLSMAACLILTWVVLRRYNRQLIHIENTDELTGLYNRRLFALRFEALRRPLPAESCLFLLDVDCFKEINDTRGHLFGNQVLALLGEELRRAMGETGLAARWGGDEFIGFYPAGLRETRDVLQGLMDAMVAHEAALGCHVTLSAGVVALGADSSLDQAVAAADEALYRAKDSGRNQVVLGEKPL